MKMSSSIILSDFSLLQGKKKLLISSSLCLNETGLYYLTGPNGSGKTTLLSALSGRHSFKGSYVCQSKTVDENSNGKSLPDVGLVLSDSPLIGNLSVKDNILFLYKDKDKNKLDKILEELDLTSVKDSKVKHLSEGEKRRTQLGIELFSEKKIILIDEPTASLDENNSKKIIQIIRELSKTRL
ncbi:MAG: ATP-binding cassette domain-containing protein, partial [Bacilli bacterium]